MVSFSLVSAIGAVLVASVVAPLAFIVYDTVPKSVSALSSKKGPAMFG